jgi:hypothetical protein
VLDDSVVAVSTLERPWITRSSNVELHSTEFNRVLLFVQLPQSAVADHLARKHGLLVDLIQDAMFDGE